MANKDSEILPGEDAHNTPCDFNKLLSTMEHSCFADEFSVFLKSCEPLSVTNPDLGEPNIPITDALVTLSNSIVLTESSEQRDNDGKESIKIDEIKRSSTRKSTRKISSNQTDNTKLAMRKSRRTSGKKPMLDLLAANVGRGRRSNFVRRARPLTWGLGGKIDEIFKQYAENNVDANDRIGSRHGGKESIQNPQDESRALNKGLLLKLKLGTKAIQNCRINTIPDMDKDLDIYREFKVESSTLESDIKDNYVKEVNGNLDKQTVLSKSSVNVIPEIHKITEIGESVENKCLDPGTSPDSEVINVIPETQISGNTSEDIRVDSKDCITISNQSGDCDVGSRIPSPEIVNEVLLCEKQIEGLRSSGAYMSITTGIASSNTSSGEGCPMEPLREMLTVESVMKDDVSIVRFESVESKSNSQDFEKSSKSKSSVNKNRTNGQQNGSPAKGKGKEKSGKNQAYCNTETHPVTGSHDMNEARGLEKGFRTAELLSNSTLVPSEYESRQGSPRRAWVCCDDCHKWRRISAVLADSIDSTQCRWICKDNMDKVFADCTIPQEKSNADINEELELSEASCEEDASNTRLNSSSQLVQKQLTDPPQSAWKLIKTNMFLHRSRKNQPIDEVMVCHCKPPLDGRMGCRDECLNRMLNIECVKGMCPCGDFCSNQQFQKRKYSILKHFPSGKKGYGLQLQEDIFKGRFLIEYVGEVLDMPAYEARQKEYASKGHKHFYFMTLNGSEVIDACAKGNLGRFINHSCEPNCRTEKWMVNGEVCIGLFAIRDIKKGEELTFDYNYVRVFGAAAKKCVCGSSRCRGVIGGDPLNDETVVLGDSDDEYPEPVTFYGNSNNKVDNVISVTQTNKRTFKNDQSPDSLLITDEKDDDPAILIESTEREVYLERSSSATSASESKTEHTEGLLSSYAQPLDSSFKVNNVKSEIKQQNENITSVNLLPEDGDLKKKPKSHTNEKKCTILKPQSRAKLLSLSSAVKKGKYKSKQPEIDNKPIVVPQKPKKLVVDNLTGRFEAVEEALNTLLSKGGISKRRDAWKGYLMLLCLTANGGNGEGIQSNRDLSMILDALLRTKSRTVLLDIINKNGLQLLHILLKRYRKVFSKTPILRKLLKVLEFLAETKILMLDNILKPSHAGAESFKESILSLTEHADKEVHQIARNFRDRYIPWHARRVNRAERDPERIEFQQTSNSKHFPFQQHSLESRPSEDNSIKQSVSGPKPTVDGSSASCLSSSTDGTRIRKRKSRWDEAGDVGPALEYPIKKDFRSKISGIEDQHENMDVDFPPGFSSPVNHHRCKTVMGQPQDRYISRLPTAFGFPCSVVKKIGTPDGESGAAVESWIVAPAMTFHPFPPLPVYLRGDIPHVNEQQSWHNCNFQRDRNPNTLGKRYFKQQKWNNSRWNHHPNKYGPPAEGFNRPNQNQPNIGFYQQQQQPHH